MPLFGLFLKIFTNFRPFFGHHFQKMSKRWITPKQFSQFPKKFFLEVLNSVKALDLQVNNSFVIFFDLTLTVFVYVHLSITCFNERIYFWMLFSKGPLQVQYLFTKLHASMR